jgi:hypothetical protein
MKKSMRREKESRFNILFDIRKEKQWEIKEKEVCSFSLPLFFLYKSKKEKIDYLENQVPLASASTRRFITAGRMVVEKKISRGRATCL